MRLMRADEETQRFGAITLGEEFSNDGGGVARSGDVKPVARDVIGTVSDLAEGGGLVAEGAEFFRERRNVVAFVGVVVLGPIAGGHKAGQHRGTARRTGGRSDEGVREHQAVAGELLHVGRAHVGRAVGRGVELGVIVGEEDYDVGARRVRRAQRCFRREAQEETAQRER